MDNNTAPVPKWTFILLCLYLCGVRYSDAIGCFQCNVFSSGVTNTCDNPRQMSNCFACLKTYTKIRIHNRLGEYSYSEVISRYCIAKSATALIRDAGCYYQKNNGGYTERCYCYEHNCNSPATTFTLSSFAVLVAIGARVIMW
ncbi:uncharacterized protein [Haliotis asinina]|uniref:uncharacterized protein n=1 Tax=Haliotis asinina TaxID=109174 RepID=UPI003532538F